MLATSSSARRVGGPPRSSPRPGVGRVAHVTDVPHHERGELVLVPARRAHVESVRATTEFLEIEWWQAGRGQSALGAVRGQHARCGGPDAGLFPRVRGHDPPEQVGRRSDLPGARGENFEGGGSVVAVDPPQNVFHRKLLPSGGMEEGREERCRTFGPVVLSDTRPVQAAGADHRVGGDDGRVPSRGGRQRRPADTLDTAWTGDLTARVEEKGPTVAAARGCGGTHDIGLGRGRDNRTF